MVNIPTNDPRVIRVLLRYREAIAVATERAYRELEALGVEHAAVLRRGPIEHPTQGAPR